MAIVGIDLGTTNSLISVWKDGKCEVIPNSLGDYLTASIVAVDDNGELVVGELAKEIQRTKPDNAVGNIKNAIANEKALLKNRKVKYTALDLAEMLILELMRNVEDNLGEEIEKAAISVPLYFTAGQRDKLKMALERAGECDEVQIADVINDVNAALIANYYPFHEKKTIMAINIGTNSINVSVWEVYKDKITMIASIENEYLGGKDITDWIVDAFLEGHELDVGMFNDKELATLYDQVDMMKKQLSESEKSGFCYLWNGYEYEMEMSREDLNHIIRPMLGSLTGLIEQVMDRGILEWVEIDELMLMGNTSKIAEVKPYLETITNKKVSNSVEIDKAVAIGTAMYVANPQIQTQDVCPYSIGFEKYGSDEESYMEMKPVIIHSTALPASRTEPCTISNLMSKKYKLKILRGKSRFSYENETIGKMVIDLPVDSDGNELLDVRFSYDARGVLEIEATIERTGTVFRKVIVDKDCSYSQDYIDEIVAGSESLKVHPGTLEKNQLLIKRLETLWEESSEELDDFIDDLLWRFHFAIQTQDIRLIEKEYERISEILDLLERTPQNALEQCLAKYTETNENEGGEV